MSAPSSSSNSSVMNQSMNLTLDQAARALPAARYIGDGQTLIARVHSDTRTLAAGDLFVALRGPSFDGATFLLQAASAGAVAALVDYSAEDALKASGLPGILVPDVRLALSQLAAYWRRRFNVPVIAVTGSNGKTTVTQMIAAILRSWLGTQSLATEGNLNNEIGVPLTVLRLRPQHRAAVIELGMNHPNEIAQLASIAQPTVALVNNAQREHQEFMLSVEAVARENGAVISALPAAGIAVYPAGTAYTPLWDQLAGNRAVLRFGENSQNCEAIVVSAQWSNKSNQNNQNNQGSENDSSSNSNDRDNVNDKNTTACNQTSAALDFRWLVQARINQQNLSFELFSPGRHNLYNAIAAACCAYGAGAPLIAISKGLAAFRPVAGRSQAVTLHYEGHALTLIDDTYNANPDSVRALIDLMQEMPTSRILLLGDMGETGSNGPQFHREIGRYAYEQGIELLLTVGQQAQGASEAYNELCRQANETNDINNESSSEPNTKPNSKPDSKLNTKPDNQPDNQFSNKLNNQLNNKNDSQLTHRASNHCHDENTAARSHARCCARHFASQAAAGSAALAALPLTATVAVKGSRFMHMEQVVQMLLAACQNGAGDLSLGKGSHAT